MMGPEQDIPSSPQPKGLEEDRFLEQAERLVARAEGIFELRLDIAKRVNQQLDLLEAAPPVKPNSQESRTRLDALVSLVVAETKEKAERCDIDAEQVARHARRLASYASERALLQCANYDVDELKTALRLTLTEELLEAAQRERFLQYAMQQHPMAASLVLLAHQLASQVEGISPRIAEDYRLAHDTFNTITACFDRLFAKIHADEGQLETFINALQDDLISPVLMSIGALMQEHSSCIKLNAPFNLYLTDTNGVIPLHQRKWARELMRELVDHLPLNPLATEHYYQRLRGRDPHVFVAFCAEDIRMFLRYYGELWKLLGDAFSVPAVEDRRNPAKLWLKNSVCVICRPLPEAGREARIAFNPEPARFRDFRIRADCDGYDRVTLDAGSFSLDDLCAYMNHFAKEVLPNLQRWYRSDLEPQRYRGLLKAHNACSESAGASVIMNELMGSTIYSGIVSVERYGHHFRGELTKRIRVDDFPLIARQFRGLLLR